MSNTHVYDNYTEEIAKLPPGAFLGSLLFFSISMADVNLENARRDLESAGLSTATLRKNLRPVDAFRKAAKEFSKKFPPNDGVRTEILVRAVGDDDFESYFHVVRERAIYKAGKKRTLAYDKLAELTFTRGRKDRATGEYVDHGVTATRMSGAGWSEPLTPTEDQWLSERLITFQDRYDHLLRYMDSHAVRTFVRGYIYSLSGTCVKESGGLYFVKQEHDETLQGLAQWVRSIGSEFHTLPLLNLGEQRDMILEALQDEVIKEVDRLTNELAKILKDPDRKVESKTFDQYADEAVRLQAKIDEYQEMLGDKATVARIQIDAYKKQVLDLLPRIRQPKELQTK